MLKIRLFCANGMSTSLLVKKMEEAAKEKGKEVDIKAYPILDMERLRRGRGSGGRDPDGGLWHVQRHERAPVCIQTGSRKRMIL